MSATAAIKWIAVGVEGVPLMRKDTEDRQDVVVDASQRHGHGAVQLEIGDGRTESGPPLVRAEVSQRWRRSSTS